MRSTASVGSGVQRSKQRQRHLSFYDHVLDCRNDKPDMFEDYDTRAIAQELFKRGVLTHENAAIEVLEWYLSGRRRLFDPNFDMDQNKRSPSRPTTTPKPVDLTKAVLSDLNAKTTMRDGRPLGEWTFGELRQEWRGLGAILDRFADIADDELVGDHLK